jgi:hypothetical protein
MGIHFDDMYYDSQDKVVGVGEVTDDFDTWAPAATGRLSYLEFIRDVTFGSNPSLKVVKCRKYPEFGLIDRADLPELIDTLENCECGGDGCEYCIPGLRHKVIDGTNYIVQAQRAYDQDALNPDVLVGKAVTVKIRRGVMNKGDDMNTMDPDFYDRQAADMLRKAEILRTVPQSDAFPDGTVLQFSKTFISQGTAPSVSSYDYAAIKAGGLWHVTGDKSPNNIFWGALTYFIGINNLPTLKVLDTGKAVPIAEYVANVQKALEKDEDK